MESFVNKISGQISKELDFICTNNVIVDAVLNTKYQEIRDKGIVFVFKINDLSSLNISDEDVVVIMSNLLNNAIEACEKCRGDKIIKLKIVIEDNNAIISVKILMRMLLFMKMERYRLQRFWIQMSME